MESETFKPFGVYKKIFAIMSAIDRLQKDDEIKYKSRDGRVTSYRGLSEEKVTTIVREKMVENRLIVIPISQTQGRIEQKDISTVDTMYRFIDIDDGSYIDAASSGMGYDSQDKAVGKAMTYAYKYLFLRSFAIPTGEDPDKISSSEIDDKRDDKKTPPKQSAQTSPPVQKHYDGDLYSQTIMLFNEAQNGTPLFSNADRMEMKRQLDAVAKDADKLREYHETLLRTVDERKTKMVGG